MLNRLLKTLLVIIFVYKCSYAYTTQVIPDSTLYYTELLNKAIWQHKNLPYRSYQVSKKCYKYFVHEKDTLMVVKCLLNMSEMRLVRGNYSLSFDHSWEGLYLANKSKNNIQQAQLHIRLARLYDMFSMDDEVYSHLSDALEISKDIYFQNEEAVEQLIASYMNLAVKERKSGNYKVALKYLDSCLVNERVVERNQVEMTFINAERGYIMLQ